MIVKGLPNSVLALRTAVVAAMVTAIATTLSTPPQKRKAKSE